MNATQHLLLEILAAIIDSGAFFETPEIRLFQNDIFPAPTIPIGDYVTADYDGYADESVTWLAPSLADDGSPELVGTVPEFRPTGSVTPNLIYGALILDGAGALCGAWRFPAAPIIMGSTMDSLLVIPRIRPGMTGHLEYVS